jgi:hypothetical protein
LGVRRHLVGQIVNLLREEAEFVDVRDESDISPDPNDNVFCACAEDGAAAFICDLKPKGLPSKEIARESNPAGRSNSNNATAFFEQAMTAPRTAL